VSCAAAIDWHTAVPAALLRASLPSAPSGPPLRGVQNCIIQG
jgi:hypothetical protein